MIEQVRVASWRPYYMADCERVGSYENGDWPRYLVPLTPPVIDGAAKHVFTNGQCHSFAVALHDLTGGRIVLVAVSTTTLEPDDAYDSVAHLLVEHDGKWMDITGSYDPDEVIYETNAAFEMDYGRPEAWYTHLTREQAVALTTSEGCEAVGISADGALMPMCLPVARQYAATFADTMLTVTV